MYLLYLHNGKQAGTCTNQHTADQFIIDNPMGRVIYKGALNTPWVRACSIRG